MLTSITYLILLIILGILFPLNGVISSKSIKKFFAENPNSKLIFYKQTCVIQIVLATLVLAAMAFNQDSITKIGLSFVWQPLQLPGLLIGWFLGWWLLHMYFNRLDPEKLRRGIARIEAAKFLLPATDMEYRWSMAISFAAGICEEIVFRGFLYWQLAQLLPVIPAVVLANLIFGLGHYATGLKNASLAFGLGILLSIIYLSTDSLLIPMLIHVETDIYSMTKGKRYFDLERTALPADN